jgi:hypothetical protein
MRIFILFYHSVHRDSCEPGIFGVYSKATTAVLDRQHLEKGGFACSIQEVTVIND